MRFYICLFIYFLNVKNVGKLKYMFSSEYVVFIKIVVTLKYQCKNVEYVPVY